jgi:hypothetical protein
MFILTPGDMFQAVLIAKSEKESKMHQISIPEEEIRSILYQQYQQRLVFSEEIFITAEENTRKQILQGVCSNENSFSITNIGLWFIVFYVCFLSLC